MFLGASHTKSPASVVTKGGAFFFFSFFCFFLFLFTVWAVCALLYWFSFFPCLLVCFFGCWSEVFLFWFAVVHNPHPACLARLALDSRFFFLGEWCFEGVVGPGPWAMGGGSCPQKPFFSQFPFCWCVCFCLLKQRETERQTERDIEIERDRER